MSWHGIRLYFAQLIFGIWSYWETGFPISITIRSCSEIVVFVRLSEEIVSGTLCRGRRSMHPVALEESLTVRAKVTEDQLIMIMLRQKYISLFDACVDR